MISGLVQRFRSLFSRKPAPPPRFSELREYQRDFGPEPNAVQQSLLESRKRHLVMESLELPLKPLPASMLPCCDLRCSRPGFAWFEDRPYCTDHLPGFQQRGPYSTQPDADDNPAFEVEPANPWQEVDPTEPLFRPGGDVPPVNMDPSIDIGEHVGQNGPDLGQDADSIPVSEPVATWTPVPEPRAPDGIPAAPMIEPDYDLAGEPVGEQPPRDLDEGLDLNDPGVDQGTPVEPAPKSKPLAVVVQPMPEPGDPPAGISTGPDDPRSTQDWDLGDGNVSPDLVGVDQGEPSEPLDQGEPPAGFEDPGSPTGAPPFSSPDPGLPEGPSTDPGAGDQHEVPQGTDDFSSEPIAVDGGTPPDGTQHPAEPSPAPGFIGPTPETPDTQT